MFRAILVGLSISLLLSCNSQKEQDVKFFISNEIIGLASPIQLNPGNTIVNLEDYFIHPNRIDSISLPQGIEKVSLQENLLELKGTQKNPIDILKAHFGDTIFSVPIKASRKLEYSFSIKLEKEYKEVAIKANFNGWNHKISIMNKNGDKYEYSINLFPGEYQYLLVLDGKEQLDPTNTESIANNTGGYNSRFVVGDINAKTPFISGFEVKEKSFSIKADSEISDVLVIWENQSLPKSFITILPDQIEIKIPALSALKKRSQIRIWAYNSNGLSNDMLIPLENGKVITNSAELNRKDKQSMRMYFLMVDRFFNGNESNDKKVDDPDIKPIANYLGGDIQGVKQKVEDGFFNELNMNTVWLSPIGLNPEGAWGLWNKGGVKSKFSGYHGYWPASSIKVDYRFGSDEDLRQLVEAVHESRSNILLDYVANHVHQEHPVYKLHPEWATELYLPDGTLNTEKWDEYRLTTWFDTFLPTLDLENPVVYEAMSDSALFWFQNFEIDGFRHDATKHIPEVFWRCFTKKLKNKVMIPQNRSIYQIGETYGNAELIGSYVSSGQMDAQFDFNVYDKAINVFSNEDLKMSDLALTLKESLSFYGYHNLMGYISGNQDRPRFTSLADGSVKPSEDSKLAGWTREIKNNGEIGFQRMAQLHALNFTIPGIPVIYYGDEIGIPGGNDPDNRRMMIFENLNEDQMNIKNQVIKLANLRKENMALNYGDLRFLQSDEATLVFERVYFNNKVVVIFNNVSESKSFSISGASGMKSNFGNEISTENGNTLLTLKPHTFEVLTQQ